MNFTPLVLMPEAGPLSAASADIIEPQLISGAAIAPDTTTRMSRVSFADLFEQAIEQVNDRQQEADHFRTAVETGASDDVAGAMIVSQKASLTFQSVIQVRNRAVSAYETIFNMPV